MQMIAEPYAPVIDGDLLTEHPYYLISKGEMRPHTPILFGIQEHESELFMNIAGPLVNKVSQPPPVFFHS